MLGRDTVKCSARIVALSAGILGSMGFTVALSRAATIHVERDGSGDYTTIQPAIDAAAPGDTVLVGPGNYTEYSPFDGGALIEDTYVAITTPNLTIRGTARDRVVIGSSTYEWTSINEPNGIVALASAQGLVVESLSFENIPIGMELYPQAEIRDCRTTNVGGSIVLWLADGLEVEACEFYDSLLYGVAVVGPANAPIVRNCTFDGSFPGVWLSSTTGAAVEDCTFASGARVKLQSGSNAVVSRCQFTGGGSVVALDASVDLYENFLGRSSGVLLDVSNGIAVAERNVMMGGGDATVAVRSGTQVTLTGNHILNNGGNSVRVLLYASSDFSLDFRNNYWGTADSSQIAAWIRDGNDASDPGQPIVQFSPFADGPVSTDPESMGAVKARFAPDR